MSGVKRLKLSLKERLNKLLSQTITYKSNQKPPRAKKVIRKDNRKSNTIDSPGFDSMKWGG